MTFLRALRYGSSFLSPFTSILRQYQCHHLLHRAVHPVFHAWTKDAEFDYLITSFGRKLLVAILRSFTCGQTIRRRMCSLKASLPLASSSCVTTGYSTMGMSRREWPYRRLGQVLGKCSTKVLVNCLIQLMFTTALSRRAQIKLFPDWLLHHVYLLPLYPQ